MGRKRKITVEHYLNNRLNTKKNNEGIVVVKLYLRLRGYLTQNQLKSNADLFNPILVDNWYNYIAERQLPEFSEEELKAPSVLQTLQREVDFIRFAWSKFEECGKGEIFPRTFSSVYINFLKPVQIQLSEKWNAELKNILAYSDLKGIGAIINWKETFSAIVQGLAEIAPKQSPLFEAIYPFIKNAAMLDRINSYSHGDCMFFFELEPYLNVELKDNKVAEDIEKGLYTTTDWLLMGNFLRYQFNNEISRATSN